MNTLATFILIGGILHLGLLIAGALVPSILKWRETLAPLPAMTRHIIWTHGAFIVLIIIGFALMSLLFHDDLAAGSTLARAICGFVSLFWLSRLVLQLTIFDGRPYLTNWFLRIGYHGLTVVFTALSVIYGTAAIHRVN